MGIEAVKPARIYDPVFKGPSPTWDSPEMILHSKYLIESFQQKTNTELLPGINTMYAEDPSKACQSLYTASNTVILSHGTQENPVLNYSNSLCQQLFEASWREITMMPSRETAEPMNQAKREQFMQEVKQNGLVMDYHGIRKSLKGQRFEIKEASVWNIEIEGLGYLGQAAMFCDWDTL